MKYPTSIGQMLTINLVSPWQKLTQQRIKTQVYLKYQIIIQPHMLLGQYLQDRSLEAELRYLVFPRHAESQTQDQDHFHHQVTMLHSTHRSFGNKETGVGYWSRQACLTIQYDLTQH